jgi:AcrR family transcriptional regulator
MVRRRTHACASVRKREAGLALDCRLAAAKSDEKMGAWESAPGQQCGESGEQQQQQPPGDENMTAAGRRYHHGDLRAALLVAALEIIEDTGPQGLTIREVARRAGVSHAAPYRHFADKDELILAVVEQGFTLLHEHMMAARELAGSDPLAAFAASGEAYVSFALRYSTYYRVMFSGDLLNSTGHESLQHTSSAAFTQMVADLKTCQDLGVLRKGDPLLQGVAILSTVHGFVSLANDNRIADLVGDSVDMERVEDFVISTIFEGLGVN